MKKLRFGDLIQELAAKIQTLIPLVFNFSHISFKLSPRILEE